MPLPSDPKRCLSETIAWYSENPTEYISTISRLFETRRSTVDNAINRTSTNSHGRHNAILSSPRLEAILYIQNCYINGNPATKKMVFRAICALRASNSKPPPSSRWFTSFLKGNPTIMRTIKTKPVPLFYLGGSPLSEFLEP